MADMRAGAEHRQAVRRRLRRMAVVEFLNIPLHGAVAFGLVGLPTTPANRIGFGLFALLLIEGAAYWAVKLEQLSARRRHIRAVTAFRAARVINPLVLVAGLAIIGHAVVIDPGRSSWPGLAYALFAVLEHINYFHRQIMHDTPTDLRRLRSVGLRSSHLARDLARAVSHTSAARVGASARLTRHPPIG
jgi:hypothetical protein